MKSCRSAGTSAFLSKKCSECFQCGLPNWIQTSCLNKAFSQNVSCRLNKASFCSTLKRYGSSPETWPGWRDSCPPVGIAELRTQCLNPDGLLLSNESRDFLLCYCFVHLGAQIMAWPADRCRSPKSCSRHGMSLLPGVSQCWLSQLRLLFVTTRPAVCALPPHCTKEE